ITAVRQEGTSLRRELKTPPGRWSGRALGEIAQHEIEHAAVAEVLQLRRRIDPAAHRKARDLAVRGAIELHHQLLARRDVVEIADGHDLIAREAQALPALGDELQ